MSVSDTTTAATRGARLDTLVLGGVVALAIGLLLFFSAQRQPLLRSGTTGFDGLAQYLNAEEIETRVFTGGWNVNVDTIGLNIIPVYDTRPGSVRSSPQTEQELLMQVDENDLPPGLNQRRASKVQTLIILPKWRSAVRLTGIAHPFLLIPPGRNQLVLDTLTGLTTGNVTHVPQPFQTYDYVTQAGVDLRARLYTPQVFAGPLCDPIIGDPGELVLAACPLKGHEGPVFILSDPDLLNNHGLRLGDNAAIARDFLGNLAGDKPIHIDYSLRDWLLVERAQERPVRERTWADLLRFFAPPFLTLWLSAAAAMALVLWRSGVRFGPLPSTVQGPDASKLAAIEAQARLYRLTGQDGALLREYLPARLAHVASTRLGSGGRGNDAELIRAHLKLHAPDTLRDYDAAIHRFGKLPHNINAVAAIAEVDNLERILEKITHDT
mgnify:CR=1 FL=1